jgi:beta-RFAP synthase
LRLVISPAERLSVEAGTQSERVEQTIRHAAAAGLIAPEPLCQIRLVEMPQPHVGLGAGTQLALAVVRGVMTLCGQRPRPATELAPLVGRGRRSAIGTHGFDTGGLVIESGKVSAAETGTLVARIELPDAWRCVLVIPQAEQGLWGGGETAAFESLPAVRPDVTAELCREALLSLGPSARDGDFDEFSESVFRFNHLAGQCYAPVQPGPYAEPFARRWVERLRDWKVRGVGQSSWGPTVFAFTASAADAENLAAKIRDTENVEPMITRPARTGAVTHIT